MSTTAQPPVRRPTGDPRVAAFCSHEHPEIFHAVAYRNDIWKDDPFDVESIHEEARSTFQRLVNRANAPSPSSSGRILLLQGEAGSGKTHLMRAFRNWTHSGGRGYCGYMQMTSSTSHYGRYVLNNLIDSLDQPYHEPTGETSGLMRLSNAVAECSGAVPPDQLDHLRNGDLDPETLASLIDALADAISLDDRFNDTDIDLIRVLLYLQTDDPRIKGRVLKYLRCEGLSAHDRKLLGGTTPRLYDDAPQWLIQRLGELMAALESVPLILCVDQLEDIYNLEDPQGRFRRAVATLCDLISRIPTSVVVISCLEDYYISLRENLTRPLVDRIENDPKPIRLKGSREQDEITQIIARRLEYLYESLDASFQPRGADLSLPIEFRPEARRNAHAGRPRAMPPVSGTVRCGRGDRLGNRRRPRRSDNNSSNRTLNSKSSNKPGTTSSPPPAPRSLSRMRGSRRWWPRRSGLAPTSWKPATGSRSRPRTGRG